MSRRAISEMKVINSPAQNLVQDCEYAEIISLSSIPSPSFPLLQLLPPLATLALFPPPAPPIIQRRGSGSLSLVSIAARPSRSVVLSVASFMSLVQCGFLSWGRTEGRTDGTPIGSASEAAAAGVAAHASSFVDSGRFPTHSALVPSRPRLISLHLPAALMRMPCRFFSSSMTCLIYKS